MPNDVETIMAEAAAGKSKARDFRGKRFEENHKRRMEESLAAKPGAAGNSEPAPPAVVPSAANTDAPAASGSSQA